MGRRVYWLGPLALVFGFGVAEAGGHHGGHSGGGEGSNGRNISPVLVGAGVGYGAYFMPPFFVPVSMMTPPPVIFDRGDLLAGPMPPGYIGSLPQRATGGTKRPDSARAAQYLTLGDRLFRAGNTRKAEERYEQALRSDPKSAAPHLRLVQLALVRGQYSEAASQLRQAEEAEPGWLVTAPDVQALFAEPADFGRHIAALESHLQTNPDDRDAWLVLGAEWFLSGRTKQATDVFVRLSDRHADAVLAAFLDATTPRGKKDDQ